MDLKERNRCILEDYNSGMEINELTRSYGVSDRRICQILQEQGVTLRPRKTKGIKKPISGVHIRIGLKLYRHRQDQGFTAEAAAEALGWTMLKLRNVERGLKELELLDLMDLAAYTGTGLQELVEKK